MKYSTVVFAAAFALAATLSAAPAWAQNARSFVSGHGLDTNACTLAAPCRTFAAAFTHTNAGGEIDVLDTAGYGPLTITHAISIVNDGSVASVLVPSAGVGITISAGTNDAINLRGLTIEGGGVGLAGIQFNTGASLAVENCVIRHMTGDGIAFLSTTATSAVTASNSLLADNGINGIRVQPTGSTKAVFNHVETNNNGATGIVVRADNTAGTNTIYATVTDSVAAGNSTGYGVVSEPGQAPTILTVVRSLAADNGQGLSSTLRLANSTLTGNANGWLESAGTVRSYGDNYIDGNAASETAPTSTVRK